MKASTSQCGRDLADDFAAQGIDPAKALGTVIVDISNPRNVCSVFETRVNEFLAAVSSSPLVEAVTLERGYQRTDDTEPPRSAASRMVVATTA